jgi:hypothetical protein
VKIEHRSGCPRYRAYAWKNRKHYCGGWFDTPDEADSAAHVLRRRLGFLDSDGVATPGDDMA